MGGLAKRPTGGAGRRGPQAGERLRAARRRLRSKVRGRPRRATARAGWLLLPDAATTRMQCASVLELEVLGREAQARDALAARTRLVDRRRAAGAEDRCPSTSRTEEAVAARSIHRSSFAVSAQARMRASSSA